MADLAAGTFSANGEPIRFDVDMDDIVADIVIDDKGADAFRFALMALAAQGRDILWNEKSIETRKGKSIACNIRFSLSVCSTCFNLTTFCLSRIFIA